MASTSRRALRLLSLLGSRRLWPLRELADALGCGERTVRRDIETLRGLDYPITTVHGPDGGYRLGAGHTLPPRCCSTTSRPSRSRWPCRPRPARCSAWGTTRRGRW
ncbi:helix-turn-helix transcriptional regulator [Streptomyces sp. NPDC057939]|uniref:helix-turn-helix transcriptional regulator n=1 Tax=Streptomyces sp. NPDC057939 TaxID=3346284 RepID=UPI0036E14CC3